MAKDPAVLWYWNDWHSGTILMSRHQKGCYMDLLHAQFNHGPLSLEEVKAVLGGDFGNTWPSLQKKFSVDPNGFFFNERLEGEKKRRLAFSEKQRNNRLGKTKLKPNQNQTKTFLENENEIKEDKRVQGEKENELALWTTERKLFLNDEKWFYRLCTGKNISKVRIYAMANTFLEDIDFKEDYKPLKELKNHFINWLNKNKDLQISPAKEVGPTTREQRDMEALNAIK